MKNKIFLFFLLVAALPTLNPLHMVFLTITEVNQVNTYIVQDQEVKVKIHQDVDGSTLTLDGNGQALILNSIDFLNDDIKHPIKSITIINAPASEIHDFEIWSSPLEVIDSPYSYIGNCQIANFADSSYTYGLLLNNSPHTEIFKNTIYNITSTSNSVSGIHLVNSQNTTIKNNTIEKIASTSTGFVNPRDVYGVRIYDSNEVEILKTRIKNLNSNGYGYGIFLESSTENNINDSIINEISSKSSYGVYGEDSSTTVVNNTSISNIISTSQVAFGISLEDSPHSKISQNNIITIDASFSEVGGVFLDHCTGAYIKTNTIQQLSSYGVNTGISLQKSESVDIEKNDISNLISSNSESIGIFIEKCGYLGVNNNSIADISPSYGLYIISCNETQLQFNEITNVDNWIYIDETSQEVQYLQNKVDSQTLTLQTFVRPADPIIEEGNTSSSISWVATDTQAQSYAIFKDDVLKESDLWISGSPIIHKLNYSLPIGQHSYRIVLTESTGNQIIDIVKVSVIEMDLPQLVNSPDDLYLSFGASDQVISWTLIDSYPSNYFLYFNGTEIVFDSWDSAVPITCNFSVLGIEEYTVYNYTLVATDLSGNTIIDTVLVFVYDVEIKTKLPSQIQYEYEKTGQVLNLNWTVYSNESGFYTIFQDNGTTKTIIDTGVFEPGEPILYQVNIDDLPVGTYEFKIVITQDVEDSITVIVYANPDIPGAEEQTGVPTPHQPIPPYLAQPAANPWPALIMGGFIVLSACVAGYWIVTRHLMVPSAVKDETKALKKARKVKNVHEEGKRLGAIGRIYYEAGNFKKAINNHKEALEIFKKTGDKKLQIQELESLGNAYLALGVDET
ncbi:MAG: right-handed parallel beta-helix repeat-containing protein [Candidatus Heimdallarchaeota archaeon]|nr:MAG: right-handed parallel beta-helix repeat-containing protein [Candidatus Heimdallarchaeota archaeon]